MRTEASGEEESGDCKPLQIADLCEVAREDAAGNESASCRARTYDPLIKSQREMRETPEFSHVSPQAPAVDTAVETKLDADLQRILDTWPTLPEAFRAGIVAMITAARKDG